MTHMVPNFPNYALESIETVDIGAGEIGLLIAAILLFIRIYEFIKERKKHARLEIGVALNPRQWVVDEKVEKGSRFVSVKVTNDGEEPAKNIRGRLEVDCSELLEGMPELQKRALRKKLGLGFGRISENCIGLRGMWWPDAKWEDDNRLYLRGRVQDQITLDGHETAFLNFKLLYPISMCTRGYLYILSDVKNYFSDEVEIGHFRMVDFDDVSKPKEPLIIFSKKVNKK